MAELTDVRTLLDYRTLTEIYEAYGREEAGPNPLFDFYTEGTPSQYDTDEVEFVKLSRVRDPAPVNYRGQPARVLQPTGKGKAYLSMLNAFDVISLGTSVLNMIRYPDQWALQDRGRVEIEQQMQDFSLRHTLTKFVYQAKFMQSGLVYIGGDGEILESSTGSAVEVPTGIPPENMGAIPKSSFGMGTGNIIDLEWDDPAALILDQLDEMDEATERRGGQPLRHIWMNRSNRKLIRNNAQIQSFYGDNTDVLSRDINQPTFEIENRVFHFYGGMYEAADGTFQPYISNDKAIITPEPGEGGWLAHGEGLQMVPTSLDIAGDMATALANWQDIYGDFSYVLNDHNPPAVKLYMGFNWLFGFRNPSSVFVPTIQS